MGVRGLLAAAVLLVGTAHAVAATARGGRTIAEAPKITLGQQQVNSTNSVDFYRVTLRSGDQLTLRYGPQQQYHDMEICVFEPGVTDATVGNQPCYAHKSASSDDSFTVSARVAGDWIIAMVAAPGCESNGILNLRCTTGIQYYLTAYVKHATKLTLSAPNAVRHGSSVALSGRLTGATGSVVLEQSWDGGDHWSAFSLKHVGATGGSMRGCA